MVDHTMEQDQRIMQYALSYAKHNSTDKSTQNAALLVDKEGTILLLEANRFPAGVNETDDRWERPNKYYYVEHAERNVIYSAAKSGIAAKNLTMYCPWFACADCARAIIQAGIKSVVGLQKDKDATGGHWAETVTAGDQMLDEAGVERRYIIMPKCGIWLLRNGINMEF